MPNWALRLLAGLIATLGPILIIMMFIYGIVNLILGSSGVHLPKLW